MKRALDANNRSIPAPDACGTVQFPSKKICRDGYSNGRKALEPTLLELPFLSAIKSPWVGDFYQSEVTNSHSRVESEATLSVSGSSQVVNYSDNSILADSFMSNASCNATSASMFRSNFGNFDSSSPPSPPKSKSEKNFSESLNSSISSRTLSGEDSSDIISSADIVGSPSFSTALDFFQLSTHQSNSGCSNVPDVLTDTCQTPPVNEYGGCNIERSVADASKKKQVILQQELSSEAEVGVGKSKNQEVTQAMALSQTFRRPPDLTSRLASIVRSKCIKPRKNVTPLPTQPSMMNLFTGENEGFIPIRVPFPVCDPVPKVEHLLGSSPCYPTLGNTAERHNAVWLGSKNLESCVNFSADVSRFGIPKMILRDGLIALAKAIATHDNARADKLMQALEGEANSWGTVMERITAHFLEALSCKRRGDGHNYRGDPLDVFAVADALDEFCRNVPYLPFWIEGANGCVLDSIEHHDAIHIIDFSMWYGQWPTLFSKLMRNRESPPVIRFTGVDIPIDYPRGVGPRCLAHLLQNEIASAAERLGIRFEFQLVCSRLENLKPSMFDLRENEALVVNCGLCIQQLLDDSVIRYNPRDSVLRLVRDMSPTVVVMCGFEANFNSQFFLSRFREALDYYIAIYDSHDLASPRSSVARHLFEGVINKPQIMEIVSCEGTNRYERPERIHTWISRMARIGMTNVPPSLRVRKSIKLMFSNFPSAFQLLDHDGFLFMGWKGMGVATVSAWRPMVNNHLVGL